MNLLERIKYGKKQIEYYNDTNDIRHEYYIRYNKKNGPEKFFYHSGKLNKNCSFVKGKLDGKLNIYYPSGALYISKKYKLGKMQEKADIYPQNIKIKKSPILSYKPYVKKLEKKYECCFEKYKQISVEKISKKGVVATFIKFGKNLTGITGLEKRKKSKQIEESASAFYNEARKITEYREKKMKEVIDTLNKQKFFLLQKCVGKFLGCLKDLEQQNKEKYYEILEDVEIDRKLKNQMKQITPLLNDMKKIDMSTGQITLNTVLVGTSGALTASAVPAAITSAVGALASASTGTAISTLSGAAAKNAIWAWLGGGALASGGGGVSAGATILGIAQVTATGGVVIISGGLMATCYYSNKLTQITKNAAKIVTQTKEIEKAWIVLDAIIDRSNELIDIANKLYSKVENSLNSLIPLIPDFDYDDIYYIKTFQQTALLIESLIRIINTPVTDKTGKIYVEGKNIIESTKKLIKNTELITYE